MSGDPETEKLTEALLALTSGSVTNEIVQQVQQYLQDAGKHPSFIVRLASILTAHPSPAARHLSAILLRRRISAHWSRCEKPFRDGLKGALLGVLSSEPEVAVRRSAGHLVAVIAKHEVPRGRWPELLPFLSTAAAGGDAAAAAAGASNGLRVSALEVFAAMADSVSESLAPHASGLAGVFLSSLGDADPRVRGAALKAFGATVPAFIGEEPLKHFAPLIPAVLQVIQQCVEGGDEDVALDGLEVVHELLTSPGPLMRQYVPGLIQLALGVATSKDTALQTRERFLATIELIAEFRNSDIRKVSGATEAVVRAAFELLVEPPQNEEFDNPASAGQHLDGEENVDGDELEAYHLGTRVLSSFANELPAKRIYPIVAAAARECLMSGDMPRARAGLLALGVVAEGCEDLIKADLPGLVPAVIQAGQAPSVAVREAAVTSLALMAESLMPDFLVYHQDVFPFLLSALADASPAVQKRACFAIEVFCDDLGDDIVPYLEPLMAKLADLLHGSADVKAKEMAVAAIGSTAAAAADKFVPYFERTLQVMGEILAVTEEEFLPLRARAMECAGCIAVAVGRAAFEPYIPRLVDTAVEGLELDFYELREYTFGFFSNLSTVLGTDVVPLLPRIIPPLFESIESDDVTYSSAHDEADKAAASVLGGVDFDEDDAGDGAGAGAGAGGDDDGDDDEDEFDAGDHDVMTVRTAFLDEKATAIQCLGIVAKSAGEAYMPFLEQSMVYIMQATRYFHEDVRANALQSIVCFAQLMQTVFPPNANGELSEECQKFSGTVFPHVLDVIKTDEVRMVVAAAASRLAECITTFGEGSVRDPALLKKIVELTNKMFRRKTLCQRRGAEDDDEDEDIDQDAAVINGAGDLVIALSTTLRGNFADGFGHFLPQLLRFMSPTRSASDRIAAVATVAQVAMETGEAFAAHVPTVLPVAIKLLGDENIVVQRNAAFAVGILVSRFPGHGGVEHLVPALQGVAPLFVPTPREVLAHRGNEEASSTRDNAASCLARLAATLVSLDEGSRPLPLGPFLEQALPPYLEALPLISDFEEEEGAYPFFARALVHEPCLIPDALIPAALSALARSVRDGAIHSEEQMQAVVAAGAAFASREQAKVGAAFSTLAPADQEALKAKFGWGQ